MSKPTIIIRPIASSDKETWLNHWSQYNDFYKRTIPTNITDSTFSRFLDDSVRMYAAVAVNISDNDKVVGFAHYYPHLSTSSLTEQVYLHDLFVDPSVRNGGVGRKLIEYVYEAARGWGCESVYWHTQYFNHRAQLLYTSVGERTPFVVYSKQLV